jgi:hypothetical protein
MVESKLRSSCLFQKISPQPQVILKRNGKRLLYLPEISLSVTTKNRTRRESKDHGTHGLLYVTWYAGWKFIVKFPHHEIIIVFVRGMVSLIEHK